MSPEHQYPMPSSSSSAFSIFPTLPAPAQPKGSRFETTPCEPTSKAGRPDQDTKDPLAHDAIPSHECRSGGIGSIRRRSFFAARRSRSGTATSRNSSIVAALIPMASTESMSSSRTSPPPTYSLNSMTSSWASDRDSMEAKSFFAKQSKRIRRHTSKFSLTSLTVGHEDVEESSGWRNHQEGIWACRRDKAELESIRARAQDRNAFTRRSDQQAERLPELLKRRKISEPFNFQHITHTSRGQFPELDRITPNELTNEFSAARAAQSPQPELRGIPAEDLHFRNFSSDHLAHIKAASNVPSPRGMSPAISPRASRHVFQEPSFQMPNRLILAHDSTDTSPLTSPVWPRSPTMHPPPRTSSMAAFTFSYNNLTPRPRARPSLDSDNLGLESALRRTAYMTVSAGMGPRRATINGIIEDQVPGQAVTTPDDSAWQLRAPVMDSALSELAQVAEQDEPSPTYLPSRTASGRSTTSSINGLGLRHSKSVPDLKAVMEHDPLPTRTGLGAQLNDAFDKRPVSQMSDTLGRPQCPPSIQGSSGLCNRARRISGETHTIQGCWEDDIDWCYENAAEADCEFSWHEDEQLGQGSRLVFDLPRGNNKGKREAVAPPESPHLNLALETALRNLQDTANGISCRSTSFKDPLDLYAFPKTARPSLIVPDGGPGVELHPSPAGSSSTYNDSEAVTPSEIMSTSHHLLSKKGLKPDVFGMHASIIASHEFDSKILEESIYHDFLQRPESAVHDYSLYESTVEPSFDSATDSFRSSNTPLSKCDSQDSIALAVGTATSRGHGSISSASSLPELVYSRNRRIELDAAVHGLAENVASLMTVDEVSSLPGHSSPYRKERTQNIEGCYWTPRAPTSSPAVRRARARSDAAVKAHSIALSSRTFAAPVTQETALRPISSTGRLIKNVTHSHHANSRSSRSYPLPQAE